MLDGITNQKPTKYPQKFAKKKCKYQNVPYNNDNCNKNITNAGSCADFRSDMGEKRQKTVVSFGRIRENGIILAM